MFCLNDLKTGQSGRVVNVLTNGTLRRRFADIGLISGTRVKCVGVSPFGDPKAYLIRGAVIAIRNSDSKTVMIGDV